MNETIIWNLEKEFWQFNNKEQSIITKTLQEIKKLYWEYYDWCWCCSSGSIRKNIKEDTWIFTN